MVRFNLLIFPIVFPGKFRKQITERAEPAEQLKQQYDGFLTPTEYKHHNFVAMER